MSGYHHKIIHISGVITQVHPEFNFFVLKHTDCVPNIDFTLIPKFYPDNEDDEKRIKCFNINEHGLQKGTLWSGVCYFKDYYTNASKTYVFVALYTL